MPSETEEAVELIAGENGFWKSDTEKTIRRVISNLTEKGISEKDAADAVTSVAIAMMGEYGE